MRTLRCISRSVNGMTEIALPTLFLGEWKDGEERPVEDEVAAKLLGEAPNTTKSPFFEEVLPPAQPAPAATSTSKPTKSTAQTGSATSSPSADGGNA